MAAALFAVDPGLGVRLRGSHGPARDAWLEAARMLTGLPWRRLPLGTTDDRLFGGLDLAATLGAGRPVHTKGVLADAAGGVLLIAMAERLPQGRTAIIAAALDDGGFGVIALDEGEGDEAPPVALIDRLALSVDASTKVTDTPAFDTGAVNEARARLNAVVADNAIMEALCAAALALGVHSVRACLMAVRTARASAALHGRNTANEEDAALAAQLVLAHRATQLPAPEPAEQPDEAPQPSEPPPGEGEDKTSSQALDDRVLAAALAALPPGLLERLGQGDRRKSAPGRAGAVKAARRGRTSGVRAGAPSENARLNIIETIRAAAPWQKLRTRIDGRVAIRRDDFRVNRLKQRGETLSIFVVDASGSQALNRLAESKGAVELLLSEAYARRDHVAVVAFRSRQAQMLLPPTRSLARAKRELAALPGGGGTPLAAGLNMAAMLADTARRKGQTPAIVLLTDGRANVTCAGAGDRAVAFEEAQAAARRVRAAGFASVLIDTSPKRTPQAETIAAALAARYVALPYADARALAAAARDAS